MVPLLQEKRSRGLVVVGSGMGHWRCAALKDGGSLRETLSGAARLL